MINSNFKLIQKAMVAKKFDCEEQALGFLIGYMKGSGFIIEAEDTILSDLILDLKDIQKQRLNAGSRKSKGNKKIRPFKVFCARKQLKAIHDYIKESNKNERVRNFQMGLGQSFDHNRSRTRRYKNPPPIIA